MQLAAGDRDRRAFDLTPTLAAVKILYTAPRGPHLSRVRSGHRIAPPPKHSFGRLLRIWIPHPSPGGPWGVAPPPGAVQGAPPPLKPLRLRIPCGTSPWTAPPAPLSRRYEGLAPLGHSDDFVPDGGRCEEPAAGPNAVGGPRLAPDLRRSAGLGPELEPNPGRSWEHSSACLSCACASRHCVNVLYAEAEG